MDGSAHTPESLQRDQAYRPDTVNALSLPPRPDGSAPEPRMAGIHITDIEAAINWWRGRSPSVDGITACPAVRALAEVYALMVYYRDWLVDEVRMPAAARQAWLDWYAHTPDTPCIAICSTAQGDAVCKGCGRTELEVQLWPQLSPGDKRLVWRRITMEATAWRFNRYAERAGRVSPGKALLPVAKPPSAPDMG